MNKLCKNKQFGSNKKDFDELINFFKENNIIDSEFLSTYELLNDAYIIYSITDEVGEKYCNCIYSLLMDLKNIDKEAKRLQRHTNNKERARKIQSDIDTLKKAKNIFTQYSSQSDVIINELNEAINELEALELRGKKITFKHKEQNISLQYTSFLTTGNIIFDKRLDSLKPHPNILFNVINEGIETFKRSMKTSSIKYNERTLATLHGLLKEYYT